MAEQKQAIDSSVGSLIMAVGKLEAKEEESNKQRTRLFELNEKQFDLLKDIREEMRVSNAQMKIVIDSHSAQLATLGPRVDSLEASRERGIGVRIGAGLGYAAGGSGLTAAGITLLRKWGWL